MFCTNCGTRNEDTALTCIQCGNTLRQPVFGTASTPPSRTPQAPIAQAYAQPVLAAAAVPNYLVQAILVTVFCCLPFGIVSIVYAAQVNSKLAIGDVAGATQSSRSAKAWAWVSFGAGALWAVGVGLFAALGLLAGIAGRAGHVH